MSIARATRKQLLDHLAAASAAAGHYPDTTNALLKAFANESRAKTRELIATLKAR